MFDCSKAFECYINILECDIFKKMDSRESVKSDEEGFERGEIVWAKITGYPWWPAVVTSLPTKNNGSFRVDFFCDNTHAYVLQSKMEKYAEMRRQICLSKNMNKALRMAIMAADETQGELVRSQELTQRSNASVENENQRQKQLLHQSPQFKHALQENLLQDVQKQKQQKIQEQDPESKNEVLKFTKCQREIFITNLLTKYKLMDIPQPSKSQTNEKKPDKKIKRKNKLIRKRRQYRIYSKNVKTVDSKTKILIAKKIHSYLFRKNEIEPLQRKQISLYLTQQIMQQKESDYLFRLLKWIELSPSETISNFYHNWSTFQSEKEKTSWMTNEE